MNAQLFAQSPLLALPLFALFAFAAVFLSAFIHTLLQAESVIDSTAGLPLTNEDAGEGGGRDDA
jgi:hypothetical protein